MRYCSIKNCVNNNVLVSEIFHNIRKEWIEQVIWKTKHPIFICSGHFDKNCFRNKDSKILKNGAVPSIFKMGCVNNLLQAWPFIPKRESKQRTAFRGGLIYPWKDLVKVCEISEKKIRETRNNRNLFYNKNILHYLCVNSIYLCWGT